jgi:chromosome segregation protein
MDIYLDKIEIHGFKSFPEKTVIKFHKGITAVVGPNGCGKSNIVDAILWVLGEQRIKNLRGENNEDLIFNGSSTQKPLGMTEVASHFMKEGEPLYFARRFFRTGESKYILNEKYCRNKDIQDALFDMRLGERKYFIFEQGSIEKLISLKPSEKRILIEEAAGISQYLERKKETANKLIIAEQNLENLEILSADKEGRLKELKNQVNYARRYRQQKIDRDNHLKALLVKQKKELSEDFGNFKEEIEKLMSQETLLTKDISSLEKESLKLEETRWQIDKDLKSAQKAIFDINQSILTNQKEVEKANQRTEFIKERITELKRSSRTAEKEITGIQSSLKDERSKLEEMELRLKSQMKVLDDKRSGLDKMRSSLESIKSDEEEWGREVFRAQGKISGISNTQQDLERRSSRVENEIAGKKELIKELEGQVNEVDLTRMKSDLEQSDKEVARKQEEIKGHAERRDAENQGIVEAESRLNNCINEISTLESQKTKYNEIKLRITGQSEAGEPAPSGDLIFDHLTVKKDSHKIVENFYYDEMDAIPVQADPEMDTTGGKKFLFKRKIVPLPPDGVEKEPGFICWVKDICSHPDPETLNSLKTGVVVDQLKAGIKIFQKFGLDIVTKEGETISKDGLYIRDRERGLLDVVDEIRMLERRRSGLIEDRQRLESDLESKKTQWSKTVQIVEEKTIALNSLKETRILQKTKLDALQQNREANLKRARMNQSEIDLLQLEQKKLTEEILELEKEKSLKENDKDVLEKKLTSCRGERDRLEQELNAQDKQMMEEQHAIQIIGEKQSSTRNRIKELESAVSKMTSTVKQNGQDEKSLNNELTQLAESITTLMEENDTLSKQKGEREKVITNQEKEFDKINQELKTKTQKMAGCRRALEEVKENRNDLEIKFSSIKKDLFQIEDKALREMNLELDKIDEPEDFKETPIADLEQNLETFDLRLARMRDSDRLNFSAESEYDLLSKDFDFLQSQREDVLLSIQDMNDAIAKIDEESRVSFLKAFSEINEYYKKNFKILFEGGEAELSLTDEENINETGLEIKAQPPGKKLQGLRLLSGGEKALTSLAFLFSLFEYKPSPFCVFDEVDASLDEANIQRFLNFLHKLKEQTQFLIITHNFKTMEEADYIYGISMNEPGISTIYSMKLSGKDQLIPDN